MVGQVTSPRPCLWLSLSSFRCVIWLCFAMPRCAGLYDLSLDLPQCSWNALLVLP